MGYIPVQIFRTPLRVEPPLVQVLVGLGFGDVGMGLHSLLKVLPHVEHDAFVVPPVDIMLFGLFEVGFPSVHSVYIIYKERRSCVRNVIRPSSMPASPYR